MMALIGFLAGMVCGAGLMVVLFVVAVLKMHKVEQTTAPAGVKPMPIIVSDSTALH